MRHDLLDHLRTHEKDRWTLIHINSYTYITHIPGELSTFPSLSKMHLFHLTLPSLFRDTYFVPLLPVQRFRYFRDGWPSWIYMRVYTYISRGVQATLLRADVFVWPSFHWLRKKRGRVVKVQSVKRRVMNLDLIYILRYFLFFLFFFISNYYSYSIS